VQGKPVRQGRVLPTSSLPSHRYHALLEEMVVLDIRKPSTFRVSPAPLYNSFSDVAEFVALFASLIRAHAKK
jgi:kynureninase